MTTIADLSAKFEIALDAVAEHTLDQMQINLVDQGHPPDVIEHALQVAAQVQSTVREANRQISIARFRACGVPVGDDFGRYKEVNYGR